MNDCPLTSLHLIGLNKLVNCFLKAHEGNLYFSRTDSASLANINSVNLIQVVKVNVKAENIHWWTSRHAEVALQLLPEGL